MNTEPNPSLSVPEEDGALGRRIFLKSIGKWSGATIAAAIGGAAWLGAGLSTSAGAWVNRRGGWVNGRGAWVNGGGAGGWVNRVAGGGWVNRAGGGGGGWVNRRGGGGTWVNRR